MDANEANDVDEPVPIQMNEDKEAKLARVDENFTRLSEFTNIGVWYFKNVLDTDNDDATLCYDEHIQLSPNVETAVDAIYKQCHRRKLDLMEAQDQISDLKNNDVEGIEMAKAHDDISACVGVFCAETLSSRITPASREFLTKMMTRSNDKNRAQVIERFKKGRFSEEEKSVYLQ